MAALKYSAAHSCACGKPLRVFESSGKTAKRCSDCGGAGYIAKQKPVRVCWLRKCCDCGTTVAARSAYCKPCFAKRNNRKVCECKGCGKSFRPRSNRYKTYCSRACAFADIKARRRKEKEPEPPFRKVWFRQCVSCGISFVSRYLTRTKCTDECKAMLPVRACKRCGTNYQPKTTAAGGMPSRFCSEQCKLLEQKKHIRKGRRVRRKKYGSDTHRHRAKKNGVAYEPINRLSVFERDGWCCQICGKPTPQSRLGKRYANAPELDHRMPLSKGGAHMYINVQCSCRACNAKKSNLREIGQLGLFNQ